MSSRDNALLLTQLVVMLLGQAQTASAALRKAFEEGRDVSDEEVDLFAAGDDAAKSSLARAIAMKRRQLDG